MNTTSGVSGDGKRSRGVLRVSPEKLQQLLPDPDACQKHLRDRGLKVWVRPYLVGIRQPSLPTFLEILDFAGHGDLVDQIHELLMEEAQVAGSP